MFSSLCVYERDKGKCEAKPKSFHKYNSTSRTSQSRWGAKWMCEQEQKTVMNVFLKHCV